MDVRGLQRPRGAILAALLLVSLIALLGLARALSQDGTIVIGTDVIFRPSQAWVDITFSTQQTFLREISVSAAGVTFDNVSFEARKLPPGLPRAGITITKWAPNAGQGITAIQLVATSDASTTVFFNVTGLRTDALYEIYVDGRQQALLATPGQISFAWSSWPTHTFDFVAHVGAIVDSVPPAAVSDLRVVVAGTNYVILEWTAPGDDGTSGRATFYEVRYRTNGPINDTDFQNGTAVPAPTPQPAGASERLNVTRLSSDTVYWFAVRASDEVPNWSPISNVLEVLTAVDPSDLATASRAPIVNGIWFTPSHPQLDVVFSKSMNTTTVEHSLILDPNVPYRMEWVNDAHVRILIGTPLMDGVAYLLTIEPNATDRNGNPMVGRFTFQFTGIAAPGQPPAPGFPGGLVALLLVGIAGSMVAWVPLVLLILQKKRKLRTLQDIVVAQAKRIMDLRGRIFSRRVDPARRVLPFTGRK